MENKFIILSAPSGAGKTTILKELLKRIPNSRFVPSTTTRKKRSNEVESDYNYISIEDFKLKTKNDEFVEWEEVYENTFYGTLKSDVESTDIVFLVKDVVGGMKLKKYFGEKGLTLFIKPPSLEILEKRIRKRGTDDENTIQKRLEKAKLEMEYEKHYDFTVTNDILEDCVHVLENIILLEYCSHS